MFESIFKNNNVVNKRSTHPSKIFKRETIKNISSYFSLLSSSSENKNKIIKNWQLHVHYCFSCLPLIYCDVSIRSLQDAPVFVFLASHQNQLTPPCPTLSPPPPTLSYCCQNVALQRSVTTSH